MRDQKCEHAVKTDAGEEKRDARKNREQQSIETLLRERDRHHFGHRADVRDRNQRIRFPDRGFELPNEFRRRVAGRFHDDLAPAFPFLAGLRVRRVNRRLFRRREAEVPNVTDNADDRDPFDAFARAPNEYARQLDPR